MAVFRNFIAAFATFALSIAGESASLAQPADGAFKRYDNSIVTTAPPAGAKPARQGRRSEERQAAAAFRSDNPKSRRTAGTRRQGRKNLASRIGRQIFRRAGEREKAGAVADEPGIPIDRNQRRSLIGLRHGNGGANRKESWRYDAERNIPGRNQAGGTTPPALPRDIGDAVVGIDGLQPWARAIKRPVRRDKNGQRQPRGRDQQSASRFLQGL